ncbi:MAG: hypothetical protein M1833_002339 [Piccolia ochrophora]|nr:MAG: hypothetical protein M1833_002339 [Piccolia ochrophora]
MAYSNNYNNNQWGGADDQGGYGQAINIVADMVPREQFAGYQPSGNNGLRQARPPQLGATFTPGGTDDYFIPEVISPAPQRIMPEVPGNIQDNLAHLELEAHDRRRSSGPLTSPPAHGKPAPTAFNPSVFPERNSSRDRTARGPDQSQRTFYDDGHSDSQAISHSTQPQGQVIHDYRDFALRRGSYPNEPSFSPFPKLRNPAPNVPQTDEEKEATLEQARMPVLNSNDPEVQLAWAQDALAYVEVSMQHESRVAVNQPARSQTPQIEHQLREDAINVVSFLADQYHPRAEFMRGMWLEFGKFGFRVDKKEAFRCYTRAAEKQFGRAEYRIGMLYENSNDLTNAIKHYNQGVAMKDSASHYRLGMMTLLGQHGHKQDFARGSSLIRFAADTADENAPQGAYVYGMLQARELDPKIDIPELFLPFDIQNARVNIEKAAYLGFAKAQLKMGSAYELCLLGCDFDPSLSLHYNALAARQGVPEADMAISKWFLCGHDGVFEKNEELAYTYAQRAADSGLPTAEFAMGYFHEIGMYVPADINEAQKWYEKAAAAGNKDAIGRIDGISRSKTLSKQDHEDVAIARIKSQHGSQRGKKPDRTKINAPPLPSIVDERLDMPDPMSPSASPRDSGYLSGAQNIPRPASAAPYPLEDGPLSAQAPSIPHGPLPPQARPVSAAAFANPHFRPSSAFGINPNIRVGTEPSSNYRGSVGPGPMPRPVSSVDNLVGGRGRGLPNAPGGGRVVSSGSVPPEYLNPHGAGRGAPLGARPPSAAGKPQPPRLDIGFSAPPDPTMDKRNRLQKSHSPASATRAHLPSKPGAPLKSPPPPKSAASHSQSMVDTALPQSGHPSGYTSSTRPSRSRPASPAGVARHDAAPSSPAHGHAPSKAAVHPSAVAPRPPGGKGPKTFDEMGVPQTKKEEDCVVM